MKVLVCGGRDYTNRQFLFDVLDGVHSQTPISLVIEGGATGADRLARSWAIARGIAFQTFEANWKLYGGRAGPVRNAKMLRDGKPDLVVAFPGLLGTPHMVKIATDAGVRVLKTWEKS